MLKLIVLAALISIALSVPLTKGIQKLKVHRTPFALRKEHKHPYQHNENDFYGLATSANVGSTRQNVQITIDTLVSDLELYLCPSANTVPAPGKFCYNSYKSSTFQRVNERLASDTMTNFFNYVIPNVTFATSVKEDMFNGNLGLGLPDASKFPGETLMPNVWIYSDNPYTHYRHVFAINIVANGMGDLQFGDNAMCGENPTTVYTPVTSNEYWQLDFDAAHLGKAKWNSKGQAVIDTKSEYIGMPKKFLDQYTNLHNITWDGLYQAYTISCDKAAFLPDLNFIIGDRTLTIRIEQYIYFDDPLPNGNCVVNFEDSKVYGFGPEWYFGIQIMKDYCVSFDYTQKRMGFTRT
ncbi:hypothetical protein QR680_003921 [Steinernema hermaphroditum]|uniref:Peptidase A1 domain-containing protein n=1 Tax=Steinernema hermaphroditum TaxID=289476 RepID=A0AA39HPC5_9BILA|nr:hypothetical protein QR680_003921 [Steinernema hermaphroditum]